MDTISLVAGFGIGAGIASLFWIGLALYAMHPKRDLGDSEHPRRSVDIGPFVDGDVETNLTIDPRRDQDRSASMKGRA
jgi:hypothetical protein